MKSKKMFLVLLIIVGLVIGWMITLKNVSGIDDINKQKKLVEQADQFDEKQLYIRGIPLLKEALNIQTKNNPDIERKLLDAYREHGDVDDYYDLLLKMDKDKEHLYGLPSDYLSLAQYYVENWDVKNALLVARSGLQKHDDSVLEDFFEQYRYETTLSNVDFETITVSNGEIFPAYDGQSWNYITRDGQISLQVDAQEAFPFNGQGYTVVKIDNQYYSINEDGDLYGLDETGVDEILGLTDNYIIAKKDGLYGYYNYDFELLSEKLQFEDIAINNCGVTLAKKDGKWAIFSDSGKQITDFIYEDICKNTLGCAFCENRAMVKKDGAWILIDSTGEQLSKDTYIDAKAPESDGYIAVADADGKWGFIDQKGKLVIDYQYDDAVSFSSEVAAVKIVNAWGYISAKNVRVVDTDYVQASPFYNGIACVTQLDGQLAFIKQQYFDLDE